MPERRKLALVVAPALAERANIDPGVEVPMPTLTLVESNTKSVAPLNDPPLLY